MQVQVESFQAWVVGASINGQEVTPFLNRLRRESLYFPNLFDQSGQGRSSDGEFITLNSLLALDRGAVSFRRPHNRFLALPSVLRANGYTTLSAHPFERGSGTGRCCTHATASSRCCSSASWAAAR